MGSVHNPPTPRLPHCVVLWYEYQDSLHTTCSYGATHTKKYLVGLECLQTERRQRLMKPLGTGDHETDASASVKGATQSPPCPSRDSCQPVLLGCVRTTCPMSRSVGHRPIDADLASLGYLAVANHTDIPWIHALLDISSLSPPPRVPPSLGTMY